MMGKYSTGAKPHSAGGGTRVVPLLLLAACPLLARGNTLLSALVIGAAAALALLGAVLTTSLLRRWIPSSTRLPCLLVISATWVSVIDLCLAAHFYAMHEYLGIYVPLLAANCLLLAAMEEGGLGNGWQGALPRTAATAAGILALTTGAGILRELAVRGRILSDAGLLWGTDQIARGNGGLTLLSTPAGALLVLGLFAALVRRLESPGTTRRATPGTAP